MGQKFACVEGRKYPCNQYHFASQQLGVLKKKTLKGWWFDTSKTCGLFFFGCLRLNQQADLEIVFLHDFIIWLYYIIELDLNGNYFYLKLYNLIKISCSDTIPLSNKLAYRSRPNDPLHVFTRLLIDRKRLWAYTY